MDGCDVAAFCIVDGTFDDMDFLGGTDMVFNNIDLCFTYQDKIYSIGLALVIGLCFAWQAWKFTPLGWILFFIEDKKYDKFIDNFY